VLTARRIPRPTPALVVAFAALFTAMGGTGYAALKITGANVADSSLSGLDIKNATLGWKELKPDTLGGSRINEAALGTVPSAAHAANADAVGGIPAAQLMTAKPRAFEAPIPPQGNFANNAILGTSPDLQPGTYLISARLTYDNDGAIQQESCTLQVPGGDDDTAANIMDNSETMVLTDVVTSDAVFNASVSCTADGDDDAVGTGRIVAVRVD